MLWRLLALSTVPFPFVAPVGAQCGTTFEYFDQSIAPVFEPSVNELAVWDPDGPGAAGEVVAIAGDFFDLEGQFVNDLATYDPETGSFSQLAPWINDGTPLGIATSDVGRLAVRVQVNFSDYEVREWDGQVWTTLAAIPGSIWTADGVHDLIYLANGDLVAGGEFTAIGGVAADKVARWDGTSWSPLGTGLIGTVQTLHLDDQGDLIAGTGGFSGGPAVEGVARFDGSAWAPYLTGTQGVADSVNDLAFLSDGRIAATGVFDFPGLAVSSSVAIWDGADWTLPGAGIPPSDLQGFGTASAVQELPGGDLLVGGRFTTAGGVTSRGLARWDGNVWSDQIGPPLGPIALYAELLDLLLGPGGDVWAGGQILFSGTSIAGGLGRLVADCKAGATTYGTGGTGSSGPIQLSTASLPWLATTVTAQVEGLAPGAIALSLLGFQPAATPLPLVTPEGTADSTLLLVPDLAFFAVLPPSPTGASWNLALPAAPGLVGTPLYLQALSAEPLPSGALLLATSNGLELTPGQF